MIKEEIMGKGSTYRPVNREKYEHHFDLIFGVCNKHNCPKNWACYRYSQAKKKYNRSYVPVDDVSNCEFYVPAKCEACDAKGFHNDWNKDQRKFIKTTCLLCKGSGKLDYNKMKGK